MSDLEPKKLKVAELREELKTRGLDTKGNKAQLVKRLEKSLAQESGDADVNDLDDSQDATADYDTSHDFTMDEEPEGQQAMPEMRAPPVHIEDDPEPETEDAEAEEPEDAQQMEDEPEEESSPEAQQEEAHQESAAAEEDLDQEEEMKEEQQKEVQQKEEQKETPKEEKEKEEKEEQEDKPAVEGEAAEAESEAPEADQTENDGEEGKQEENRGTKRRHDEDGSNEGRHQRQRDHHHRSRRDRSRSPRRKRSGSKSPSRDRHHRHHRSQRSRSHSKSPGRKRSRSTSSARDQQHRSRFDDKPLNIEMENDDWVQLTTVILDKYNSDLNLRIHETGVKANPITVEGFAFMWAGARATYGVTSGKVGFEVKLLEQLSVDHLPADETSRHVVRVGFSVESTSLQLGEEKLSYGYGGTGKASTECSFKDYGEKFAEGDVISAYVDFESEPVIISFSKNGEDLGTCFEIPVADLEGKALYPHILTKNTEFEVNFGEKEEPAFPLKEGFTWIATLPEDQRVRGAVPPAKKEECEMIMMCGLPGSGKTTWAAKYAKENPDKKFNVLGTNTIIDKMKVMGLPRKKNYAGRWDMLIDKATKCLNRMLEIAAKKKRNYILDQTNVYPSAQRRKMRPFEGFQRKAVVIVPTDEEFKKRCEQREKEEGKEVPDSAVLEMKANFQLPEEGQLFDKVEYVEMEKEEATKLIEEYSKDAQSKLPPPEKRFNRGNYGYGGRDRGRDNRSGGYGRDKYGGGYDRNKNGRGNRRGGYMGYSQQDRNKHDNRNRNWNSGGGWGGKQGSWGGNQGGWGNQNNWNNQGWGNQGSWGNQGWGNQGWGNQGQWNYGGQGGSQGWNSQGYNYPGWGNGQNWSGYPASQSTSQNYWGNQSSYNYTPK